MFPAFCISLRYGLTCSTFSLGSTGGRSSRYRIASMDVSFVVPSMSLMASFCTLSSCSRFDCGRVVRTRATVYVAFSSHAFSVDSPFLLLSLADAICVLYVSIPSKWILRYHSLYVRCMTFPFKELFVVCWLLNVSATCECVSGTDRLRQFYVLPH